MNRSQLFEEAECARSEGNTEKEQNIRRLLMQQFKLLNSLSRDELAELLEIVPSEDWKKSEVICSKLDALRSTTK